MSVRTLNYTNRQRIRREDARITICDGKGGKAFNVRLSLAKYTLPRDARVFVEAYRQQTQYMRFDFGEVKDVESVQTSEDRLLSDFDFAEGIKFRIKIVSPGNPYGMLIAEADQIRPRREENESEDRLPLLECQRSRELGNEVWKIDFSGGAPVILLNADLINALALEGDPIFTALVAPSVLRSVFMVIIQGERDWDKDDLDDWRSRWMYFARNSLGSPELPLKGDEDKCEDWVNDATQAFCEKTNAVDLFNTYWTGAQER